MPNPDPLQLSTPEAKALIDSIASFGDPLPHLILTGGDPMERADLFELIEYAIAKGIRVSATPAATPRLTRDKLVQLKEAGVESIALSLDGSNAVRHDMMRQVIGCFNNTMRAASWAGELGIPLQINTLVAQETADDLPAVYRLLHEFPVMRWSLFMLIAVGRGQQLHELSPEKGEEMMEWLMGLVKEAPFQIKTTEAPSYRRIVYQKMVAAGMTPAQMKNAPTHKAYGIRDGNGIMFVSHVGEVYPSGFLPLRAGNIRETHLVDIYRNSFLFHLVRDVNHFVGKCGYCEFRKICGGSRARAYAHTGNPAASDPFCPYQPEEPKGRGMAGPLVDEEELASSAVRA